MWDRCVNALKGVLYFLIVAAITAAVVIGLSAIRSDDNHPIRESNFWVLVGIALAPILSLAVVTWLVVRPRSSL
jgi:hypothetical protein